MTTQSTGRLSFEAILKLGGKTATGITVPPEVVDALGAGKKPAVQVTLNGYTYRSTIATLSGEYKIPVSAEIRAAAGVSAGDVVEVSLEVDHAPREVVVPADFASALATDAVAKQFFDNLSYSNKRRFVLNIEDAKTPETRRRRIDKALVSLRESRL